MAARGGQAAARRPRGAAQRQRQAPAVAPRMRGSAGGDILGLAIAVVAIAMMISLAAPSDAPVTSAVGNFLVLCFGRGAFLFPASILILGITFFIDVDEPVSGKVALGLALIMVSVLSIISINLPGAEQDPQLVVDIAEVGRLGGFVGGGVAWSLLMLVGVWVGNVVLVGLIAAGIVICGFSISGMVTRFRLGAADARASLRDVREERRAARMRRNSERHARAEELRMRRLAELEQAQELAMPEVRVPSAPSEPATSFLGSRKTSVLTRGTSRRPIPIPDPLPQDSIEEAQTRLLRRGPSRRGARATLLDPRETVRTENGAEPLDLASAVQEELPLMGTTSVEDGPELPWDEPEAASDQKAVRTTTRRRAKTTSRRVPTDGGEGSDDVLTIPTFLRKGVGSRTVVRGSEDLPAESAAVRASKRRPTPRDRSADGAGAAEAGTRRTQAARPARNRAKTAPARIERPGDGDDAYELPPFSMLLSNPQSAQSASSVTELEETKRRLQSTLAEFGLTSRVVDYTTGPLVTTFQVEMGEGERVSKITNLQDDIALSLAAKSVRIFAPIPGTSRVGVEIPNKVRQNVCLGDVLPYAEGGPLEFGIGRDAEGGPVTANLAEMPHLLVAGATGSGKSVVINSLIMSLLMRSTPKQVRLILVDPKRVEFSCYNGLPHLYVPVVTDPRQAASSLQWAVSEMERRLKVFEHAGARNINIYNEMCLTGKLSEMENPPDPMPFMVIIIDELADLMMVAGKDVEASIVRIAQLARAAGIHLVLATQRPSANVVTGLIKSNIETRIALSVASGTDSRVILDQVGAQRLLGKGDMLFKERGGLPRRALGCFVSDPEIESVVDFIRDQAEPDYHEEILSAVAPGQPSGGAASDVGEEDDPLVWEAAQIVVESQLGSTSGLQRRLKVGYARAGRIMDNLESKGVVGPPDGSKPREVLLDLEGLEELRSLEAAYREV